MLCDTQGMKGRELCGALRPDYAGSGAASSGIGFYARRVRGLSTGHHGSSLCRRLCAGLRRLRHLQRRRLPLLRWLLLRVLARELRTSLLAEHNTVALQAVHASLCRWISRVESRSLLVSQRMSDAGGPAFRLAVQQLYVSHWACLPAALQLWAMHMCMG